MRLISCRKCWETTFALGIGLGWDPHDRSVCVFFQLGFWLLTIGPHIPAGDEVTGGE